MPPLILSLAMVVPGAVCVACAAAARPRASRTAVAGAAAMLAAMVAMSTGAMGAPIAWTATLIALALAGAVARRMRLGRAADGSHEAFDWHRPVGIVVAGALVAGMSAEPVAAGHAHGPSASLIAAAAVVYLVALVTWMVRRRRELRPRHAAEGISMAIMTAAMLAMPSVA